jgi:hypothetical protein
LGKSRAAEKDLIDRAWDTRPDPARSVREPADPKEYRRTLTFLSYVVEELERFDIAE